MNTNSSYRFAPLVALCVLLTVSGSWAQGGFFGIAPMNAMNQMNTGGVGSATGNLALQRAQTMGGPMGMNAGLGVPGAQPGMAPGMAPTGMNAMAPFGQVLQPKVTAIVGNRVYCRIMGTLMNDAQLVQVTEEEARKHYDDGTHGDASAGDGIYTNIGEDRDDVLSLEADIIRRRVQATVIQAEAREPMDFYLLHAVTLEPVSLVESEIELEAQRDEKVLAWAGKFLEKYRQNPADTRSPFWPLYIPPPPAMPTSPYPVGFDLNDLPPELGGGIAEEEEVVMEDDYDEYEDEYDDEDYDDE